MTQSANSVPFTWFGRKAEVGYWIAPVRSLSRFIAVSKGRVDTQQYDAIFRNAEKHLRLAIAMYTKHLNRGRHVLHEHPATALSWDDPVMLRLLERPRVHGYWRSMPIRTDDNDSKENNFTGYETY